MASGEGTAFGKYFLLKRIAAGGMGEIYLAKLKGPVGFEKLLVIKRILQHHVENAEFLDMFFAEARVAAQLTHSNIVQIYEMGEIEDAYFIAMEYIHGKSLRDVIDRARALGEYIPGHHAVEIVSKLAAGLSYAHNARDMSGEDLGIIHRDINPHNMLISYGGEVKVIDFGIAKSEMSMHHTETGTIKGKFVYMSPEQSAAEKLDKRSDIFAVGICLYETLTFVNPFAKANVVLSLDAIQRKDPPPPSEVSPKLAPFDAVVKKALAKQQEERYQDCNELREDLQALINSGAVPRVSQALSAYMHELFEEQIEQEKRMIVETDSANTSQIAAMRKARQRDSSGRSGKRRTRSLERDEFGESSYDASGEFDEPDEAIAAHAAVVDVIDDEDGGEGQDDGRDDSNEGPRSRLPFVLLLSAIIAVTAVASVAIVKFGTPTAEASAVLAMAPVPDEVAPEEPAAGGDVEEPSPDDLEKGGDDKAHPKVNRDTKTKPAPSRKPDPRVGAKREREREEPSKPPPEREAPPPQPAPPPPDANGSDFGNVFVSTMPPLTVTHKGREGQTFKLNNSTGMFVFGDANDAGKFHVKVMYRVAGKDITYTNVTSSPWAIVRGKGGIGLGKTPLANVEGGTSTLLELLNPKEGLRQRITLRYTPP